MGVDCIHEGSVLISRLIHLCISGLIGYYNNGFVMKSELSLASLLCVTMEWPLPCCDVARSLLPLILDFLAYRSMSQSKLLFFINYKISGILLQ